MRGDINEEKHSLNSTPRHEERAPLLIFFHIPNTIRYDVFTDNRYTADRQLILRLLIRYSNKIAFPNVI